MHRRIAQERCEADIPQGRGGQGSEELFNARLDSKTVRAIDFHEDDDVDETALIALVQGAAELNESEHK